MFYILEASEADIPTIIEIAEKTWKPAYTDILSEAQIRYMLKNLYAPETLQHEMTTGSQKFLLLKDDHGPQAFASFGKRSENPHVYKLHKLYVLPQNQHRGYGQKLIQHLKNRLLLENIHILELNVNRFNKARIFYEKVGFKIIREEDVPIGPYWMNDFVMRLEF